MAAYSQEVKDAAKMLFLRKSTPAEIQKELKLGSVRVVYTWIAKFNWEDQLQTETIEQAISRRYCFLIDKPNKIDRDFKEISHLSDELLKHAKIGQVRKKTDLLDSNTVSAGGGDKGKRKGRKTKNDVSHLSKEDFEREFVSKLYEYQKTWRNAKNDPLICRNRFPLKSRQIGATWYFAGEGFEDACATGDNQLFISASKPQAEVFRAYIVAFAWEWFEIELTGNPIRLKTKKGIAELHFLSTNSNTAQSYHGHVYFDEVFWTNTWTKLQKVASGMGSQKKWRKTYISTPSTMGHPAYKLWSGEQFNKGKRKNVDFAIDHETLKNGHLGPDKFWRHIVTIEDAIAGGCDLFDLETLKLEYSKEDYQNLFMCKFIDESQGVFKLKELQKCMVDRTKKWPDFKPKQKRPFGDRPVWLGYDPSRTIDNSTVAVVAPPIIPEVKHRVLELIHYHNQNFTYQAAQIKKLHTERYKVTHIGIDATGIGHGVYELVKADYPRTKKIFYSVEQKTELVLKGQDVIQNSRLEFDAEHIEIAQAFLQIKQTTTGKSGQITYQANRTEATGHADAAFAILHALIKEPLNIKKRKTKIAIG